MQHYDEYKTSGSEFIGKIPAHWDMKKIKHYFVVHNGATPKSGNEQYWDGDIIWVTPSDMSQANGYIINSQRKITELGLNSCGTTIVPANSIIVSNRAPIGLICLTGIELCTNQGCKSLVAKNTVLPKYGYYYLLSQSENLQYFGQGTTFLELSSYDLSNYLLPFPPQNEQEKIITYLNVKTLQIDNIIAKKEKLIELLQQYRQSVITEAVTNGLDKDVPMKDSGVEWIGEIPAHWKIKKIKFITQTPLMYGANESAELDEPGLPRYIRITDIEDNGKLKTDSVKTLPWEKALPYMLKDGDILFARSGATVGKNICYSQDMGPACFAGYLVKFSTNKNLVDTNYINYFFASKTYWDWISNNTIQATIQNVSAEKYSNLSIPIPPISEQCILNNFLNKMIQKVDQTINSTKNQIEKLKEYRQSIINEAVTGKIKIAD